MTVKSCRGQGDHEKVQIHDKTIILLNDSLLQNFLARVWLRGATKRQKKDEDEMRWWKDEDEEGVERRRRLMRRMTEGGE